MYIYVLYSHILRIYPYTCTGFWGTLSVASVGVSLLFATYSVILINFVKCSFYLQLFYIFRTCTVKSNCTCRFGCTLVYWSTRVASCTGCCLALVAGAAGRLLAGLLAASCFALFPGALRSLAFGFLACIITLWDIYLQQFLFLLVS